MLISLCAESIKLVFEGDKIWICGRKCTSLSSISRKSYNRWGEGGVYQNNKRKTIISPSRKYKNKINLCWISVKKTETYKSTVRNRGFVLLFIHTIYAPLVGKTRFCAVFPTEMGPFTVEIRNNVQRRTAPNGTVGFITAPNRTVRFAISKNCTEPHRTIPDF